MGEWLKPIWEENMVTIDWETKDPYMSLGYGPGWVFALRGYTNPTFKLLGASIKIDDKPATYLTDLHEILIIIKENNEFLMHNALYDIGCILVLFKQFGEELDMKSKIFYDSMIECKLIDQDHFSYSLDACSKRCGGVEKSKSTLTDYVWNSGMYQKWYKDNHKSGKNQRVSEKLLFEFAMSHLDMIPEEIVGDYCNHDVEATYGVHQHAMQHLNRFPKHFNLEDYSTLIKVCVDIKKNGIPVDVEQAHTTKAFLEGKTKDLLYEIYKEVGYEFNLNSPAQLVKALKTIGIDEFAKSDSGGDSANKDWLAEQPQEICQKISKAKNYIKLTNDFLTKIIKYQQIHIQNGSDDFRIFPNFNILGATKTGRMSSSGSKAKSLELNMQQIPKRGEDKEAGRYIRAIFVAEKGEQWIGADYSNQEQRLQVEFAHRLQLSSVSLILKTLISEPYSDLHQVVADFCSLSRGKAKTVNLGLSYSMGEAKLCKSLGLPTKWVMTKYGVREVAGTEGKAILDQYHQFLPFMKELQNIASTCLMEEGYVTTIDGRKLYLDKACWIDGEYKTFEYKGLSKLIQGSAAGVTMKALINCYNAGLRILLAVHDEIGISTANPEKDREILRTCMENTYDITVPMVVEISEGISWAA